MTDPAKLAERLSVGRWRYAVEDPPSVKGDYFVVHPRYGKCVYGWNNGWGSDKAPDLWLDESAAAALTDRYAAGLEDAERRGGERRCNPSWDAQWGVFASRVPVLRGRDRRSAAIRALIPAPPADNQGGT